MTLYTVSAGDSLYSIAKKSGVTAAFLAEWNGISPPYPLAIGQCLLILSPTVTHTVKSGDTVFSICSRYGITRNDLFRRNPSLCGGYIPLAAGQTLVIDFEKAPKADYFSYAYAYTFIKERVLRQTLPYLSSLAPFTYGFTVDGSLLSLSDASLLSACRDYDVMPLMHLSTLTEDGGFSNELASGLFSSPDAEDRLISEIIAEMTKKGYTGLDIDFEFIRASDAQSYADFISKAQRALNQHGYTVYAALAPKTFADQAGLLYQGHLYDKIGAAADRVFLMTYEWGYTYGPPMAVAPINAVRRVLDYAVTEIPPEKIIMGIPNYAYDWALPYKSGETRATLISNEDAPSIAFENNAEIKFDETAQSPYFNYYKNGVMHEVWFEDPRSVTAKLALPLEYGFFGVGYWNAMRPFNSNWLILSQFYRTFL